MAKRIRKGDLVAGAPLSRGKNDDGNLGIGLLLPRDFRNFKTMLLDWMLALADEEDKPQKGSKTFSDVFRWKFLEKTGLACCLAIADLQDLLDGAKVPGKRLANHLPILLPDELERKERRLLPEPRILRNRARQAAGAGYVDGIPHVEIDKSECWKLRAPPVERLCVGLVPPKQFPWCPGIWPRLSERHPFTDRLIERLEKLQSAMREDGWENEEDTIESAILEGLSDRYRADAKGVSAMLVQAFPDETESGMLDSWVREELRPRAEYSGPGRLIRFLRYCEGMSPKILARKLDVSINTANGWENGAYPVDPIRLTKLLKALNASDNESQWLTLLIRPDLGADYVTRQIAERALDRLSFPATDPEWLNAQPYEKRAGLYLAALRKIAGLMQKELAEKIGVIEKTIRYWETGKSPIPKQRIEQLIDLFVSLGVECDANYFRGICQTPPKAHNIIQSARIANILNPAWLKQQCEDRQAGLLLWALRWRAKMSQNQLCEAIGAASTSVRHWERALCHVPIRYIEPLIETFKKRAVKFDARYFRKVCKKSRQKARDIDRITATANDILNPDWLRQQPEDRQAGLLVSALRQRAELSRRQLAKTISAGAATIQFWEQGKRPPSMQHIEPLIETFQKRAVKFDADYFREICKKSQQEVRTIGRESQDRNILNPNWLEHQPEDKQAGLLLSALRRRAEMSGRQLDIALGVGTGTVSSYERGKSVVARRHMDTLIGIFQACDDTFDPDYFREVCNRSREAINARCRGAGKSSEANSRLSGVQSATGTPYSTAGGR
jgi:transcriptional regulator with XRE-family HTH domain